MDRRKVVYSICVDDIYQVAAQEIDRELTDAEIAEIANRIGDYIDWYQAIENAISDCCAPTKKA